MRVLELLQTIRPIWLKRAAQRLSHVRDVQESFREELRRFFDCLQNVVVSGDAAPLKRFADQWVEALTQTVPEDSETQVGDICIRLFGLIYELGGDLLKPEDVVLLFETLVPLQIRVITYVQKQEMERRMQTLVEQAELAQRELERLDENKSRFISVAAHELKTPLTIIDGYAAMLRDILPSDVAAGAARPLLDGISGGTARLQRIIDDMLDVSLIDNNLLQITFQPLWVDQVLDILQYEIAPLIRERRQHFEITRRQVLHKMTYGDPERLYQVFMHLVNNAIKFTPNGGRITVSGRELPGFIEVTIQDTGIGIDPEDQERIFQKFGRLGDVLLHHSSSRSDFKGGGPGLGLPIARGIIEAHGGTVWVESEGYDEEKCPGSTFHVLLPLRDAPPDSKIAKLFKAVEEEFPNVS